MLNAIDEKLLVRSVRYNQAVLFLGAGFSVDATNSTNLALPAGDDLARDLWTWMGYAKKYGEWVTSSGRLDKVFDVARKTRGDRALLEFLQDRLRVNSYAEWYKYLSKPFWRRIYTTNVDQLVERVYADTSTTPLHVVNAVTGRYVGRDQYLSKLQYVKLNGDLNDSLDVVTFGTRQYAKRSSEYDAWYDHFVRDYSMHCTILIGTQLDEPLFWEAIESRQGRKGAARELRLKSFLISPSISPITADSLDDFNVVPVETTGEKFMQYLSSVVEPLPPIKEILTFTAPERAEYFKYDSGKERGDELKSFFSAFKRVHIQDPPKSHRSLYLLGTAPTWEDLSLGLDARREVTVDVQAKLTELVESAASCPLVIVDGHRGAGKSTLCMRVALNMSAAGHLVFHGFGEDMPPPYVLARALSIIDQTAILVIDDADWFANKTEALLEECRKLNKPPLVLLALRTNSLYLVPKEIEAARLSIGDLTEPDIKAVVEVLTAEDKLGVVSGKPKSEIYKQFRDRARKQLLVALMEVTSGEDFHKIVNQEFSEIEPPELRLTYLVACLASAEGASLSRDQLVAVTTLTPAQLLSAVQNELRQVLVALPGSDDRWVARHQLIAETVVEQAAKTQLADAYTGILSVLAHDMDPNAKKGEGKRWYSLYKRLISHAVIYRRFSKNVTEARAIFEAVAPLVRNDAHFWLQYGSLELEYGEVRFAVPHITMAAGLAPEDHLIRNALGHLKLVLGRDASNLEDAIRLREEGETILLELIDEWGDDNPYPYHTLVSHLMQWLKRWEPNRAKLIKEFESLRSIVNQGSQRHPQDDRLSELREHVEYRYLSLASNA